MYKITYKQREYKNGRLIVSEYQTKPFSLSDWKRFEPYYLRAQHKLGPNDTYGSAKIVRL